ncbi:MAG: GAF domain-containing protein [Anaerolineae bacterium]
MSAATDLGNIFQMASALQQGVQSEVAPEELFAQALPTIQACLPGAQAVQIYRASSSGTLLPLIGVSSSTPVAIKQLPERTIKYYQDLWVAPLYHEDDLMGMIDVTMPQDPNPEETLARLHLVAWHITRTMYTLRSERLLRQLSRLSAELNRCKTFPEIASAIARHTLGAGQFCSINEFVHNEYGDIDGFETIATANRHDSYETSASVQMTTDEFQESFGPLLDPESGVRSLVSNDVVNDGKIPSALRDWLMSVNIKSVAIVPLNYGDRAVGFIALNSVRGSLDMNRDKVQVFERTADQVSALLQAQSLMAESAYSRDIGERQKSAFRDLVAGQDAAQMAFIVASHMLPQPGRLLSLNRIEYDAQENITGLRTLATANRERTFSYDDRFPIKWSEFHPSARELILGGDPQVVHDIELFTPQDIGPAYYQWLKANGIRAMLNVPLMVDKHPIGIFSVMSRRTPGFTREEINAFVNLADQVGALMYGRELLDRAQSTREVVDHLILANRLITIAENYNDMAQAALHTVAQNMLGAALTLFDRALDVNTPPEWRALTAFSTQDAVLSTDGQPMNDDIPSYEQVEALRGGTPVIIDTLNTEMSFPNKHRRQQYLNQGAHWAASFGLRAGDQLLGTLDILAKDNYLLSPQEIDAYVTLADQIGVAIRSRQLLEESRAAQAFAAQLVATNRMIAEAEGYAQMAMAVVRAVPREIKSVALALFDRPVTMYGVPNKLLTEVIATRNNAVEPRVVDEFSTLNTREDPRMTIIIRQLIEGQMWAVKDLSTRQQFMADNMLQALANQGMHSVVSLGLSVNTRLMGLMTFASDRRLDVDQSQLDALRAIVDQVAITLENRDLLRQTADALGFVQSQYEMTSKIYRTENPSEMLDAIYTFSGRAYDNAHLAIFDRDSQPPMMHIVAEASSGGVRAVDYMAPLSDYPAAESLAAMETFDVPDVGRNRYLRPQEKATLIGHGVGALLILPLLMNQRLTGFVYFSNRASIQIPTNRLRALRSMADQLAVKFENQKLLLSTADSLAEVRTLYDANRAMLSAQDMLDMLWALRTYVAPDSMIIHHYIITHNANHRITSLVMKHAIVGDSEQAMNRPMDDTLGDNLLAAFSNYWDRGGTRVDFMEAVDTRAKTDPIVQLVDIPNVASYVSIVLSEANAFEELIVTAFDAPRTFNVKARRLYEAITDQMVVVLQKQRLLRDAQSGAAQLASQVRVLQTLNKLAIDITSTHDESTLLNQVCQALVNALNVDHSGLAILDADAQHATVVSEFPLKGAIGVKLDMVNDAFQQQVIESRQYVLVEDLSKDARIGDITRELLQATGVSSLMVMPLVDVEGEFIGSIGLDLYAGKQFTPDMIDVAQTITAQFNVALQNIRLLEDAQTRAGQLASQVRALEMLNELSAIISTRRDEQKLFDDSANTLVKALNVDHCGIVIFDDVAGTAIVLGEFPHNGIAGLPIDTSADFINQELRRTKAPVLVTASDWDLDKKTIAMLQNIKAHSLLALPLFDVSGKMIGSAGLEIADESRQFTSDMIALAQTMTTQLAVGLQNVRLLQDARRRAEQLQRVTGFSQSVQATLDMVSIYEIAVAESTKMIKLDHLNIVLYDLERDQLRVVAQHYRGKTHVDLQNGPLVSIEGTPIGRVWESRQLLSIADMQEERELRHSYAETRSLLVAPIFSRGLVRGAVEVGSQHPNSYNDADAAVFQQMVNQLTVAIENAEAYAQSQKLAQNKALANEISAKLQRQVEMERMLDITARELGKALGAKRARIRLGSLPQDSNGG